MKKRVLSIILVLTMVIGLLQTKTYVSADSSNVPSIAINTSKKIDVALAAGTTDVDYSTFAEDLKAELLKQGNVPAEDINVSQLKASEVSTSSNSNFEWWTYDHSTSANILEPDHKYVEKLSLANQNGHPYYNLDKHIEVSNGGADLTFKGYGSSGYKDFMYLENSDPTKKTFDFDIEEGVAYDALDGVGFLFNTSIAGSYVDGNQTMTGYLLFFQYGYTGKGQEIALYKLTNVNTKLLHEGNIPLIDSVGKGFTKIATASYSSTDRYRKIRIQVQPTKVKVWYKGSTTEITDTLTDADLATWNQGNESLTEIAIDKTGSYGFGPLGSYRAHGCNLPTVISLKNLKMSTEKAKTLTEVVREPEWHSGTIKYIVNANSEHIDDFDNKETTAEIINRLNNDDVYYLGWGSTENEQQTKDFLALNDLKGDIINTDKEEYSNYDSQIKTMAADILKRYTEEVSGDIAYVLTSDQVNLTVSGADANNTIDSNWPEGKWKVVHSIDGFNNASEIYQYSGQYVPNLDVDFSLPGKYEIYYENDLIRTVIAHRKPIASFTASVVTGGAITVDDSKDVSDATNNESTTENQTPVVSNDTDSVSDASNQSADATESALTNTEVNNTDTGNTEISNTDTSNTEISNTVISNADTSNTEISNTDTSNTDISNSETNSTELNNDAVVTGAAIVYKDYSYDPDDANGIDPSKTVWKYINLSDEVPTWVTSETPPKVINEGDRYLVSLTVTDKFGEESLPFTRQISYDGVEGTKQIPYADFELSTTSLISGTDDRNVTITDKSYDLYNNDLSYNFTITKDGQPYEKDIQFGENDFSKDGAGVYRISLVVQSENGSSKKVTRVLNIIEDKVEPTASCNVSNGTTTGANQVILSFEDLGGSGLKGQQYILSDDENTPADDAEGWSNVSNSKTRYVTFKDDGTYYIHYKVFDESGNVSTGYFGPFTYEANIPYVKTILTPANKQTDVSINSNITFVMSESVVKGNGYLTIYNAQTNKKYLDIHSSNRRIKIDDTTKTVTVELNGLLSHNSEYYIELSDDFLRDKADNSMAKMGDKDTWEFKTVANNVVDQKDEVELMSCKAEQTIDGVTTNPWVSIDDKQDNTFLVYAYAGTFTLSPEFSILTEDLTVEGNNCDAQLSSDKKNINVSFDDSSVNPSVTLKAGNNTFTFKIIKTTKKANSEIQIESTKLSASVDNSNLLNAVDITNDLSDGSIEEIKVKLLISEPQVDTEKEALQDYLTNLDISKNDCLLFDASLYKTVYNGVSSVKSNIKNTQEAISILVDIPTEYQGGYTYQIYRNHDGVIEPITSTVLENGKKLNFKTDRFSTYAIVYTKNAASSDTVVVEKKLEVPTSISITAGNTANVDIKNLPTNATIVYHVCTPTIISILDNGTLFAKKAGTGVLFATIDDGKNRNTYKIKVKVTGTNLPTKVGYIPYSNQIIAYKNMNFRVTRVATDSVLGTVTVSNNQVNTNLTKEVVIPRTIKIGGVNYLVTSIDESAFYDVKTISKVTIPNSVTDISSTAFVGCKNLKSFVVSKTNDAYSAKNGMLLNKKGNKLIAYPSATGKVTIDKNISIIGDYAFSVTRGLTSVTIPSTVKEIGACAFSHSKSLVKVNFKSTTVPNISVFCIFDAINGNATINVPNVALNEYQKAFKNALQPTTVKLVGVTK